MDIPRISKEEMLEKHVVRYSDAKGSELCFIDQRMPEHEREIINVIGMQVTENVDDPLLEPKLVPVRDGSAYEVYTLGRNGTPGGEGPDADISSTDE